jgi:hypothetical protein
MATTDSSDMEVVVLVGVPLHGNQYEAIHVVLDFDLRLTEDPTELWDPQGEEEG